MTITLSAEMLRTSRKALKGRLVLLRRLLRESTGDMSATRIFLADVENTQAAISMLDDGGKS